MTGVTRLRKHKHESTRTTGLYDRRNDQVSVDEVARILILPQQHEEHQFAILFAAGTEALGDQQLRAGSRNRVSLGPSQELSGKRRRHQ